ncbi:Carbonic anhydrase 9-like protein [Dinothrombium tinctorium]|uniref:carbonic anhydrase n=1 Tax=Dinothrombium tinctorium TaxID=1965070 RepID=A0A3S3RTB8_9ACAR|nr:Carbonic anhydrase 9-like protein [Dinothrombium tinctorium]RWS04413.1 Carbonic anhydrase 9-like protein [Dinothrombium tinctorium]
MSINITSLKGLSFHLLQFHFHWHQHNDEGTEHAIDGKKFAAEMHFVHQNDIYKSREEAAEHSDGFVVLSVIFEKTRKTNPFLNPIISALTKIVDYPKNTTLQENFYILDLLPNKLNEFYMYEGSFTTPPCHEAVTWIIFQEISSISENQVMNN